MRSPQDLRLIKTGLRRLLRVFEFFRHVTFSAVFAELKLQPQTTKRLQERIIR